MMKYEAAKKNLSSEQMSEREVMLNSLSFRRILECFSLEEFAEPWAVQYVVPTMAGDVDAAQSLSIGLSNAKRGIVAVALWNARAPVPAFRAFLDSVWNHDHREVIYAAKTKRRLQAMFRYAKFDTSGIAQTVRVWRGTCALSFKQAVSGYSWTTDRDIACWFAMRFAAAYNSPLVLGAEVDRDTIAAYTNDRSEQEIVLFTPPAAVIDGTPEEWKERYQVVCSLRNAERTAFLSSARTGRISLE